MKVIDLYGNSAVVVCPECRGPYIVSDIPDRRGFRKCPHCNTANSITYAEALAATSAEFKTRQGVQ
jgi:hypothetical protein